MNEAECCDIYSCNPSISVPGAGGSQNQGGLRYTVEQTLSGGGGGRWVLERCLHG